MTDPRSYVERIRYGAVDPWVGGEAGPMLGARASAQAADDEIASLSADDPRRVEVEAQRDAWRGLADELKSETSRILKAAGRDDAANPAFREAVEEIALELVRARNAPPAPGAKPLRKMRVEALEADPLGLRLSIGAGSRGKGGIVSPDEGYLVFRGDPGECLELLERVTAGARKVLPSIGRQVGGQG